VEEILPNTTKKWDGYSYAQQDTRGATYIAAGLLWRNGLYDLIAAESILKAVLDLQYSEPLGVWKRYQGEPGYDANWREFVGCGLVIILETFSDRLPVHLVDNMKIALLRAAQGALKRNVPPQWTNIALLNAFLLDYVGTIQKREDMQKAGRNKAEGIWTLFSHQKTFNEYNSPTYYGTDLLALALWRKFARSDRMRVLGELMEADLWRDIGTFYNAEMKNMCGPFGRAYGMDMTKYYSLIGLWISLAISDNPASMPWPVNEGRHSIDRCYAPIFALLKPNIPKNELSDFKYFTGPREFERIVNDQKITVLIHKNLMMGATEIPQGLPPRWEQYCPATIYWRVSSGRPVGWILLSGDNEQGIISVINKGHLLIRRRSKSKETIRFLIYPPDLAPAIISQVQWALPGLLVKVQSAIGVVLKSVHLIEHKYYGGCLEVLYSVNCDVASDIPLLTLWPQNVADKGANDNINRELN